MAFGSKHGNFVKSLCELNEWSQKGLELKKQNPPKKLKNKPSPDECSREMWAILLNVHAELGDMLPEVAEGELVSYRTEIDRQCIPDEAAANKILRYETSIRKQRDKAIDQLLKLKKRRLS